MPGTSRSGGRNRKSLAAHALAGTGRKDRGTHTPETSTTSAAPDPPAGRPRMPSWLNGFALVEWNRMVPRLEAAKTLSIVDDAALYQYCCLFAETEAILVSHRTNVALVAKLHTALKKLPPDLVVEAIGQIVQLKKLEVKYTTQLRQGHMALRQYLVEFGMTPAARSRVQPSPDAPAPVSPLDRFTDPKTRVQ